MISDLLGLISIIVFSIVYYADFSFFHHLNGRRFTSFAAGVGTVYVFIHMLPQLSHGQHVLEVEFAGDLLLNRFSIYIFALAGFIFFYLLDRILWGTARMTSNVTQSKQEIFLFWGNIIFLALYNMLIGYVVGQYQMGGIGYRIIYMFAYILHFLTLRWGVYHIYPRRYFTTARYPLVVGLVFGYIVGYFTGIPEEVFVMFESFLTGAMILSVFKHELPNEEDNNSLAFIAGIVISFFLFIVL
jgi:hypothetical protein